MNGRSTGERRLFSYFFRRKEMMEPSHYAIPVNADTLRLCEHLQGGRIPHIALSKEPHFIIVLDDPTLHYNMGVVPVENLDPKFLILKPEEKYYTTSEERKKNADAKNQKRLLLVAEAQLMHEKGYSNVRIAETLDVSEATVRTLLKEEA